MYSPTINNNATPIYDGMTHTSGMIVIVPSINNVPKKYKTVAKIFLIIQIHL